MLLTSISDVGGAIADVARPVGDVAISFPGQANDKEAVTAPKPGEAKGLPKGPTAKPPSGPSLPKVGVQVRCNAMHRRTTLLDIVQDHDCCAQSSC